MPIDADLQLEEALRLTQQIHRIADAAGPGGSFTDEQRVRLVIDGLRLADLLDALDDHIISGGALPTRWTQRHQP
jgi:hypothetical protein